MLKLGRKYQHLAHDAGCGCLNPQLQQVSRRLDAFSRRDFLAGLGAAAASGLMARPARAQAPSGKVLFRQARLFDGRSDALKDVQVLIEGNRIAAIDAASNPPPDDATVIDCDGRVLMPGLIDAHWHAILAAVPMQVLLTVDEGMIFTMSTAEAQRTLMRGFTTVRDLGGPAFSFKKAIDEGIIAGPRIFPSGAMITTSGGHGDLRLPFEIPRDGKLSVSERFGGAAIVDDAGSLKQRVREQLLQGASQVKLVGGGGVSSPRSPLDMTTFSEDELRDAVSVARDWNTYVTVHATGEDAVRRAIAAEVPCIEHAHLMSEDTARMMADKGIWLSTQPFLTIEDAASQTGPGVERAMQIFSHTPRLYEYVKKYGIKVAWGSDLLFSASLATRQNIMLTHLANWYTNAEVLRAATSVNADLLALSNLRTPYDGKLGVVEKGALADLLVIDGNPLEDLRLIENPGQNISVIMKDGTVHKNAL